MVGRERRADGRHRPDAADITGRVEHRRTTERMADEKRRRDAFVRHGAGRRLQVLDIGAEAGIREIALRFAKAGEVEAQHREPVPREPGADVACGVNVLRAGEAVGEQGICLRPADRQVEPAGEFALTALEREPSETHRILLVAAPAAHAPRRAVSFGLRQEGKRCVRRTRQAGLDPRTGPG